MVNLGADRGKKFFTDKLAALRAMGQNGIRIDVLNAAFQDQVSVFAQDGFFVAAALVKSVEAVLSKGVPLGTLLDEVKAAYAQDRLAVTSLKVVFTAEEQAARTKSIEEQQLHVLAIQNGEAEPVLDLSEDSAASQAAIINALKEAHELEGISLDENGSEVIHLIKDWKIRGDSSTEGKRILGLLPADFDTTQNEGDQGLDVEEQKMAELVVGDDGYMLVQCPDCKSQDVMPMYGGLCTCLGCESEFAIDMTLGDFIGDETAPKSDMEQTASTIILAGKFSQVTRSKNQPKKVPNAG